MRSYCRLRQKSDTHYKMWRIPVLFLVFVFFSVQELNASYNDIVDISYNDIIWTLGSAVNVTLGPKDAVYCKLDNNKNIPVFDGFGPCRVVLDKVTKNHRGSWRLWAGVPGTVIVRNQYIFIDVVGPVDTTPRVTGSAVRKNSMVILNCSVVEAYEVKACLFTDPHGILFIANGGVTQEGYLTNVLRYESYVDRNYCTLALLEPQREHPGIWGCTVNTTQVTSHSFFAIQMSMLNHDYIDYDFNYAAPVLQSTYTTISNIEGDEKTMLCSIKAAIRYCYFRAPNGTVYNVGPSTSSPGFEYYGKGFEAGECGITFNKVWLSDDGEWTCNVGLVGNFTEQSATVNVYVNQHLIVTHRWLDNAVVVRLHVFLRPKLEYCRFVRSDGLGFTSENIPRQYTYEYGEEYGVCALTIPNPTVADLRPWTIVAKVLGEDGEVSRTTTLESRGQSMYGLSSTIAVLLWSFFGTIFVFLICVSCLPKKNRDWTRQRATHIRNSFRRHPQPQHQPQPTLQPQQQDVTVFPQPVHSDILTDLPPKY